LLRTIEVFDLEAPSRLLKRFNLLHFRD
jgi:hypothetical protein